MAAGIGGPFTLPQVIIQVLSFTLQPQSLTIEFNEDEVGVEQRATLASIRSPVFWVWILDFTPVDGFTTFHGANNKPATSLSTRPGYFRDGAVLIVLLVGLGGHRRDGRSRNDSLCHVSGDCSVDVVHRLEHVFAYHDAQLRMVWRNEK
jgi:hypothetical protein